MKLHIGGVEVKDGWKILNIQSADGVDFIGDIRDLSQFSDESIEAIYASHVLEHVPLGDIIATLKGVVRVLKRGGKLYISVPDMDVLCRAFLDVERTPAQKHHIIKMIFGGQIDEFDFHYFGWNELFLTDALARVGITSVEKVASFGLFDDYSNFAPYGFPISLNIIATKDQ
jgi:predicted SAM-dependent methyltransferase